MKIKSKNYDYGPIGLRIKQARKNKGYTQEYVAERLNVSCQHISDIERGFNGMSIPALMDFCRLLEVDADYILFGSSQGNNPLDELWFSLTPQQRTHAEEILRAYVKSCR